MRPSPSPAKRRRRKARLSPRDVFRILGPYAGHQIREQLLAVVPVCAYLVLVQVVLLRAGLDDLPSILGGILAVILGLVFFMEGLKLGLIPIGDAIGDALPARSTLGVVLAFSFFLGILAAFGEPVVGSLQIAGAGVDARSAPLLHRLLIGQPLLLSSTIALGVGAAVVTGVLRFLRGWSLKPFVVVLVGACAVVTVLASRDPGLASAVGLAWDSGAVIAGPVLVPLALAIGTGVCRAAGRADTGMSGFGMVGLISLFPIAAVLLASFLLAPGGAPALEGPSAHDGAPAQPGGGALGALGTSLRAILPIFIFLFAFHRIALRGAGSIDLRGVALGAAFAVAGLFLFNYGLASGLGRLGAQVGERLPSAFHPEGASLFGSGLGKALVVLFGAILGYGATIAEPAFNSLGKQVEEITQGAFKKWLFSQAVAAGVGIGAGLGVASLVYGIDLTLLLLPPYALLILLTLISEERFVNIAWDGGAVTTGPVTVPLKIAIGIALSHATGFSEGFGVLAMASSYPVLNILLLGLYVRWRERRSEVAP